MKIFRNHKQSSACTRDLCWSIVTYIRMHAWLVLVNCDVYTHARVTCAGQLWRLYACTRDTCWSIVTYIRMHAWLVLVNCDVYTHARVTCAGQLWRIYACTRDLCWSIVTYIRIHTWLTTSRVTCPLAAQQTQNQKWSIRKHFKSASLRFAPETPLYKDISENNLIK